MSKHVGRAWLMAVLVLLIAGIAFADDFGPAKGEPLDWWDNPEGCLFVKGEWVKWTDFDEVRGPEPDRYHGNYNVNDPRWIWSGEALNPENVVPRQGILVPAGEEEWIFDLELGNKPVLPVKLWYMEFELDRVPLGTTRLNFLPEALYPDGSTAPFDALDFGAKTLEDEEGNPYLVFWGNFRIAPQPAYDRFIWNWDTTGTEEDFYVRRVLTGTCCTPEPVTLALLALGLPAGMLVRRRRSLN